MYMIEIKKLTPELCDKWLGFFDGIAFSDHGEWAFCYCIEGHMTRADNDALSDHAERREYAKKMILEGKMQGYLAFEGDTVVGWCNANDRDNYAYIRELFDYQKYMPDKRKTKSVFCFLIAPAYRGQGIAGQFLKRVCDDAGKDGFERVEAYPFSDVSLQYQFHGTEKMYLNNGFSKLADFGLMNVVAKDL
ncbi:MAG: GNAT family N-acetyltransferase [Clostridia bacterium]|nr:GNAT family N-acetyltransferase [Clostridia bacterium]